MSRALFAICLSLFATAALAGSPAINDDASANCPKNDKTNMAGNVPDNDGTLGARTSGSTGGGVHGRSSVKAASPRWHSLLPGMFR